MNTLAELVARLALSKFDALPRKCKPRTHEDGNREWTPMSAVVLAHGGKPELTCVSLATGTKCLPSSALPKCMGMVLHDSHAEVLALRAFNYWLLAEISKLLQSPTHESQFLESSPEGSSQSDRPFRLKENVSIYFFTTEAPCGDASMEILMNSFPPDAAVPWAVDEESTADLQGRGHFSLLGRVRRKPARADAEPSLSKSCTDKLALKQFTSALSFPADQFIQMTPNSFIHSLVVYDDQYHQSGYERAFGRSGRLSALEDQGCFFRIDQLPPDFPRFLYEKPQQAVDSVARIKAKASNICVLWVHKADEGSDNVLEVLINGVKQGYPQWDKKTNKASVVSRRAMWSMGATVSNLMLKKQLEINGSGTSSLLSDIDRCTKVHRALSADAYEDAKSTGHRAGYKEFKLSITNTMGNWSRNSGDDSWSCV